MSDYGEEEQELIMRSMDVFRGGWPFTPFWSSLPDFSLFGITLGRYLVLGVFPGATAVFLALAYFAEIHSFWNLLFLELSAGFLFFAATPAIISLGRRYRWQVPSAGLLVAVPSLWLAYRCKDLLPHLSHHSSEFLAAALIEYSGALILMVGLEITMTPWLKALEKRQGEVRAAFQKSKKEQEAFRRWREAVARGDPDARYPTDS